MEAKKEEINLREFQAKKSELARMEAEYIKIHDFFDNVKKDVENLVKEENRHLLRVNNELRKKDELLLRQSKMVAMGEMISIIAHQLKQPLNTIALVAQDIKEADDAKDLNSKYIDESTNSIMNQIDFMSKTIDEFSNFFNPKKIKKLFNIEECIKKSVDLLSSHYRRDKVKIKINCKSVQMYGSSSELQQVILNVANNARDALVEKNALNPTISIKGFIENDIYHLIIKDNGGGISQNIINKIFDSYFTTKQKQGTGLGLYMSKLIIESSFSGTIDIKNDDYGAVFTIKLPLSI